MKCAVCGKRIWFWNRFYRRYGILLVYNENEIIRVPLCSDKCYFEKYTSENLTFFAMDKEGKYYETQDYILVKGKEQGK